MFMKLTYYMYYINQLSCKYYIRHMQKSNCESDVIPNSPKYGCLANLLYQPVCLSSLSGAKAISCVLLNREK